jgi:cytochrome c oxidase subunit 2
MTDYLWLPVSASEHGPKIDNLLLYMHILMAIIFVGWSIFCIYTIMRFRQKRNPKADYHGVRSHTSSFAEALVAIIEIVLLIGFAIPFWVAEVDALPQASENPFEVRVIAQQYAWNIHYPGADGLFGQTDPALVDDVGNPIGLDRASANAADDIVNLNDLRLPVNRPALIRLSTKDVIHSFGLPEFRVKQDAIPGMFIPMSFTPIMTTEAFRQQTDTADRDPDALPRDFEIVCSQLCGLGHYKMKGLVTVLAEDEMAAWIDANTPDPNAEEVDDIWL